MTQSRIVIAGTHSGVGKTIIATGIMAALQRRGLTVQGFKVGPDFIDPTFHAASTGRASRNLDGWMLSRNSCMEIFARAMSDADVAVIEGVMGLFDAKDGLFAGSTAEIAMWLDAAVVLLLDASAMAGSAAALVHGFDTFSPEFQISAALPNRVGSTRHFELLKQTIGARCRPALIGYVPRAAELTFPERHLGLHLAGDVLTEEKLSALAECMETHIELDRLLAMSARPKSDLAHAVRQRVTRARVGIAEDSAFCFYYADNLDLLREYGAELLTFSPLHDKMLPADLDGLYLGGGYPELHLQALSENAPMRTAIAQFSAGGGPIYAECGGFMYLTEEIFDAEGRAWPMAGVFPTRARMQRKLAKLGYTEIEARGGNGWIRRGDRVRGHEFRYSVIDPMPESVVRAYTDDAAGYWTDETLGSYVHLHFGSCRRFAEGFVDRCAERRVESFKSNGAIGAASQGVTIQ